MQVNVQSCSEAVPSAFHLLSIFLSSGHLQEVKNKRKFHIFRPKSGSDCLQEVVAYKSF